MSTDERAASRPGGRARAGTRGRGRARSHGWSDGRDRERPPATRGWPRRRARDRDGEPEDEHPSGLGAHTREDLAGAGIDVGAPLGPGRPGQGALRAVDRRGRQVVLRLVDLPPGQAGARLRERLQLLRELRHPALARVLEVADLPGGRAAVTSELVDGADLAVVLGARGSLTRSEGARVLTDLGSALACLHGAGLAHGDLSTSNVMVTTAGGTVLIDLVGDLAQTGTPPWAAPEREQGGPATPASDVYSLGMLLRTCAEGGALLGQRLEPVLADVLVTDPRERPSARTLAARAPEIARPGSVDLPDGARLAAGALRAAAATPTRTVASRRALRRQRRSGAGRRGAARRALGLAVVLALGAAGAWGLRGADLAESLAGAVGLGKPTTSPAAASPESSAQAAPAAAEAEPETKPGTEEVTRIVISLVQARDRAIEEGDAQALAATSVEGSSAAQADAAVLSALVASGERVEGLDTRVCEVSVVDAVGVPDGGVAVALTRSQGPSERVRADGTRRTVPAQAPQRVVLILVPDPWRVLEVRDAAG